MISSYKEITGKYLRANKKRTILTLIGIVLSVALISSIGFFFKSMQEAQIQDMKNSYGSWHIAYSKVDDALMTKIKSNPNVLRSGTYAKGEEFSISDKLKARNIIVTEEGVKLLPYALKEGRFPEKDGEVVLEKWFLDKLKNDVKLGDTIQIKDKEYTLVGVLKDTFMSQIESIGEVITNSSRVNKDNMMLLVEIRDNKKLQANVEELLKLVPEKSAAKNVNLLAMQGVGFPKELLYSLIVIIGIVVIATIAVIYNAFHISVVERVKQFGLLRAVGTTPKQIRKIILREATFLAAIAIPIGLGFGIAALYGIDIAFRIIGGEELMLIKATISLDVLGISFLVGLGSIYASALLPAIFAGRISPLVAISSRNSITKEKIKKRKSFITGKIFGFEGALASKNIRRNKKRYRTTVFSIIISVALFITFKAFMDMSLNVYGELNESSDMHFSIMSQDNSGDNTSGLEEKIIEEIDKLSQTEISYKLYNPYFFSAVIDKTEELRTIQDIGGIYKNINYNGQSKTLMDASINIYDDRAFEAAKKYLKEGSINVNKLNSENGVIIIGKNRIYNGKTDNNFYGPVADLKIGDEILLQSREDSFNEETVAAEFSSKEVKKVKVIAVFDNNPFDFNGYGNGIKIITTEQVAEKLLGKDIKPYDLALKIKDVKLEDPAKKDIERIISSSGDMKLINIIDQNRKTNAIILMIKILLFGFVIVVSLIGSVNIINTLTTNIILRRKEFATLKCIGLTQKGLRKIITLEGMLYGIVGTIYGSIIGSLFSYAIYNGVNGVREQSYKLPLDAIAIAAAGAMIIGYISVQAPLRRMKKENLIDRVREDF